MKHEHRIPAKALSFLLALVMLIGCVTIGFTAFAVEDSYQVLADALRAEGMSGVVPIQKISSSPDVKNKLTASDPHATSMVYVESAAMWNAMEAFWNVAGSVRSNETGDITVDNEGNVYSGWTGNNNTARKIAATIASQLVNGGYMTTSDITKYNVFDRFAWFIGGYTAEHALLDEPLRSEKPSMQPWSHQVYGSTGYFGVSRSRDDALKAGTKNYKQIPDTLQLNQRWVWTHGASYAKSENGSYRQYWHELKNMNVQKNVPDAAGLPYDPAKADTKALKATFQQWESTFTKSFLGQDLSGLSVAQLQAIVEKTDAAIAAAKAQDITNSLLYFYGLPTYIEVGSFQRDVEYHQTLAPYRPYVEFFQNTKSERQLSKLSDDAVKSLVYETRFNYEALDAVAHGSQEVYNGLITVNGLDLDAAGEYLDAVVQALMDGTQRDKELKKIVDVIKAYLDYFPAVPEVEEEGTPGQDDYVAPVPAKAAKYTLNADKANATLEELYEAYEIVSMAYATLTGSIGSKPHFPGYDVEAALKAVDGWSDRDTSMLKILTGLQQAIYAKDPDLYYDYVNVDHIPTALAGITSDDYTGPPAVTAPAGYERYPDSFKAMINPTTPVARRFTPVDAWAGVGDWSYGTAPTDKYLNVGEAAAAAKAKIDALTTEQRAWGQANLDSLPTLTPGTNDAVYLSTAITVFDLVNNVYVVEKTKYDNTKAVIDYYEANLLTPPAAPTMPDGLAFPILIQGQEDDYLTKANAYLTALALTQQQQDFILAASGKTYPDGSSTAQDLEMYLGLALGLDWRANTAYPSTTGTLAQKYDYFLKTTAPAGLEKRIADYKLYEEALETTLTYARNAYSSLMKAQEIYEEALEQNTESADEITAKKAAYFAAADNYLTLWKAGELKYEDGTKILTTDPAYSTYEVRGLALENAKYDYYAGNEYHVGKMGVLGDIGMFFDDYRMAIDAALDNSTSQYKDWQGLSDDDLKAEFTNVSDILKLYEETYKGGMDALAQAYRDLDGDPDSDPLPLPVADWYKYFGNDGDDDKYNPDEPDQENEGSVRDAIRNRVEAFLKGINTSISVKDYVAAIDPETDLFGYDGGMLVSGGTKYNINKVLLLSLIKDTDYRAFDQATNDKIKHAQDILAAYRGLTIEYETLHWDLWDGDYQPFSGKEWVPVREVKENGSIVLVVEQDEFEVRYEHVENLINKLDTLVTSQLVVDLLGEDGIFPISLSEENSDEPVTQAALGAPKFHLPKIEGRIIMSLGEMRYSYDPEVEGTPKTTEITNEFTAVDTSLPAIKTMRDTTRKVDEDLEIYAFRRWIQSYRGDVLLYLLHVIFEAINTGTVEGSEMLSWLLTTLLTQSSDTVNGDPSEEYMASLETPAALGEPVVQAVTQATSQAIGQLDLSAAAKPFLTQLLGGIVADQLYGDMLPNTVLGLYKMLSDMLWPILSGPLFKMPGREGGLVNDIPLFSTISVGSMLGNLGIHTINDIFKEDSPLAGLLGFAGSNSITGLLELLLGAQITPNDLVTKCWPSIWPKGDGAVPSGAPAYVTTIKDELTAIYNWLNTPQNFGDGSSKGNQGLDAWETVSNETMNEKLKWGLDKLKDDPETQQTAFIDVMAFAMSGLSFVLSAVFSDTGLNIEFLGKNEGWEGKEDDTWYIDIVIKFGWLNDMINGIIKVINTLLGWLGVKIKEVNIPNIYLSDIMKSWPHWRGEFDSRSGLFATLTPVNAYGKLFIPLFEMLNIDPKLFGEYKITQTSLQGDATLTGLAGKQYSEKNLNALMKHLGKDIAGTVKAMNGPEGADKTKAREKMYEISRILIDSLLMPLFNWIAPLEDELIPYSIGFRPVGKVLDLLPNLAFVVEHTLIPKTVDSVLNGLVLDVKLCLGGYSGDDLGDLIKSLNVEDLLFDLVEGVVVDLLASVLGKDFARIIGKIGGGIGWVLGQVINGLGWAADGIIGLFKEYGESKTDTNHPRYNPNEGRSTLGAMVGFFAGSNAAKALTIGITELKIMPMLNDMLTYDTISEDSDICVTHEVAHAKGLYGFLACKVGIDLNADLNGLITSLLGLLGDNLKMDLGEEPFKFDDDEAKNTKILELIDKVVQNENHIEGFLIELFNPQTYPNKTYMIYPMVEEARTSTGVLNEVNYSEVWTEEKANYLNNHLMTFLDNLWDFLFAQDFLTWLWELLNEKLGIDVSNLYTSENLNALLELLSGLLKDLDLDSFLGGEMIQKLLPLIGDAQSFADIDALLMTINVLKYYANDGASAEVQAEVDALKAKVDAATSRDSFAAVLYELLAPLAPILKIFLTGGRTTDAKGELIETLWYGELYPNNGAVDAGYYSPTNQKLTDIDPKNYVYNIGRYINLKQEDGYDCYTVGSIVPNAWAKANIKEYDEKSTFYTIGSEGDNLTLLEDYLGFSGYDGYRHGLIPIYEHLGVPKEDIPNYQQFVERASNKYDSEGNLTYNGDAAFWQMLLDPILNLVDRVIDDPINTVFDILPNLLYFLTAEPTAEDIAKNNPDPKKQQIMSGTTCLNECLNRLLRPIYAILDMLAPLLTVDEILGLLPVFGMELPEGMDSLPIDIDINENISLSIDLPITISVNDLVSGLLDGLLGDALGDIGLQIKLTDLTALITGELEIYKSQSGQNDAVRVNGNMPDLLTNLIRALLELIFTPENYEAIRLLLMDVGIPDVLLPVVLQLYDNIFGLMSDHTLNGHIGADLVLSMLFYLFYDADSLVTELLSMRDAYSTRIIDMFQIVAGSSSPQLRRYAERARRLLDLFYGDIISPDEGVQESGFIAFITKFWGKISSFFTGIGDWFMKLIRWLFPFFF